MASGAVGVKTAVTPTKTTVPATGVRPSWSDIVSVVMVSGSIGSLNVAVVGALSATPTAADAGVVVVTCGGVTSLNEPVVKVHT